MPLLLSMVLVELIELFCDELQGDVLSHNHLCLVFLVTSRCEIVLLLPCLLANKISCPLLLWPWVEFHC